MVLLWTHPHPRASTTTSGTTGSTGRCGTSADAHGDEKLAGEQSGAARLLADHHRRPGDRAAARSREWQVHEAASAACSGACSVDPVSGWVIGVSYVLGLFLVVDAARDPALRAGRPQQGLEALPAGRRRPGRARAHRPTPGAGAAPRGRRAARIAAWRPTLPRKRERRALSRLVSRSERQGAPRCWWDGGRWTAHTGPREGTGGNGRGGHRPRRSRGDGGVPAEARGDPNAFRGRVRGDWRSPSWSAASTCSSDPRSTATPSTVRQIDQGTSDLSGGGLTPSDAFADRGRAPICRSASSPARVGFLIWWYRGYSQPAGDSRGDPLPLLRRLGDRSLVRPVPEARSRPKQIGNDIWRSAETPAARGNAQWTRPKSP